MVDYEDHHLWSPGIWPCLGTWGLQCMMTHDFHDVSRPECFGHIWGTGRGPCGVSNHDALYHRFAWYLLYTWGCCSRATVQRASSLPHTNITQFLRWACAWWESVLEAGVRVMWVVRLSCVLTLETEPGHQPMYTIGNAINPETSWFGCLESGRSARALAQTTPGKMRYRMTIITHLGNCDKPL